MVSIKHKNIDKVIKAHNNICKTFDIEITADLTDEGNLINLRKE